MSQKIIVLEFLNTLPRNKVTTYKALAQKFNTHPRAIASYMRSNKNRDSYPCYKVVADTGWISGYILWKEEKIKRLTDDDVLIDNDIVSENCILRIL